MYITIVFLTYLLLEFALFLQFNESNAAGELAANDKSGKYGYPVARILTGGLILLLCDFLFELGGNQEAGRNANHHAQPAAPNATPHFANYWEQAEPRPDYSYLRNVIIPPVIPITPTDLRGLTVEELMEVERIEKENLELMIRVLHRRGGTVRQTQETGVEKLTKLICEDASAKFARELKEILKK